MVARLLEIADSGMRAGFFSLVKFLSHVSVNFTDLNQL